jgi:hypothetical protein
MGLEPVLGVWAGLYLDGEVVPQNQLQPYIDDVMNELEFLMVGYILRMLSVVRFLTVNLSESNLFSAGCAESVAGIS